MRMIGFAAMNPYVAEAVGTMILILLGDGVVANVLLARSKGQNSGWIVITVGWGVAVTIAVYAVGRISGAHLNPAVTIALATIGSFPVGRRGRVRGSADGWRVPGRRARVADVPAPLAPDGRSGREAGACFAPAPAIRSTSCELRDGSDRHRDAAVRRPRHRRQRRRLGASRRRGSVPGVQPGAAAAARRHSGARDWPVARRPDRLRDKPRARSRASHRARHPSHSRQGISDWSYAGSRSLRRSSAASPAPRSTPSSDFKGDTWHATSERSTRAQRARGSWCSMPRARRWRGARSSTRRSCRSPDGSSTIRSRSPRARTK